MPIHLERAAQQFAHARDTRAVLEAWRSSLLLRGRVEQRWKSWLAFNGHLVRACMHFWRMPWDGDTRAAFDAWRSSLWLRRRIEQRWKSWFNGRLLAACMLTWRMNRWWCDALCFNPRGTWVVNPRVVNPNESPTLILGGGHNRNDASERRVPSPNLAHTLPRAIQTTCGLEFRRCREALMRVGIVRVGHDARLDESPKQKRRKRI